MANHVGRTITELNKYIEIHKDFGCELAHLATSNGVRCCECPFPRCLEMERQELKLYSWRKCILMGFRAGMEYRNLKS